MTLGLVAKSGVGDINPEKNAQKCWVSFISPTGCITYPACLDQDPDLTWDRGDFLPEKT